MDYRDWKDPEIEDWEEDPESRAKSYHSTIGVGFGIGCNPRHTCSPRLCWPRHSCEKTVSGISEYNHLHTQPAPINLNDDKLTRARKIRNFTNP
ncbi:MAG: hypothetical protein H6Q69_3155 [Firmicutes bacterium]|nr:hypothetical protein [Bacillota bacterium]